MHRIPVYVRYNKVTTNIPGICVASSAGETVAVALTTHTHTFCSINKLPHSLPIPRHASYISSQSSSSDTRSAVNLFHGAFRRFSSSKKMFRKFLLLLLGRPGRQFPASYVFTADLFFSFFCARSPSSLGRSPRNFVT